jgi:hypothetical protein
VFIRVQVRARNREFTTSSQWVIGVSWEDCFCEEKIYVEYLECQTVTVWASKSIAGRLRILVCVQRWTLTGVKQSSTVSPVCKCIWVSV